MTAATGAEHIPAVDTAGGMDTDGYDSDKFEDYVLPAAGEGKRAMSYAGRDCIL